MNRATIEERAKTILRETRAYYLPIPVEIVAHRLGLSVRSAPLGDDVSGILVVEDEQGAIGYNISHSEVRQRFSIAHEIGHFVLHQGTQKLFIDKRYSMGVYHRDAHSSTGDDPNEVAANSFAAALLMPDDLVYAEVDDTSFDLGDEAFLGELAKKFKVSTDAMAYRLARLGILGQPERKTSQSS